MFRRALFMMVILRTKFRYYCLAMKVFKKPEKMRSQCQKDRRLGHSIGFVPTLGFLHEGHEALIKKALKENDKVVVSRFVNPGQFRKSAYEAYPRDKKRDIGICEKLGVDYLFSPDTSDMYPDGFDTSVEVNKLTGRLEGSRIRWHYRSVATVVAKLFNIVQPDRAYFGRKDPHQLAIIKRMVADLNFPVKIVGAPTRRDKDGVALSSRNSLLNSEERLALNALPQALRAIGAKIEKGARDRKKLNQQLHDRLSAEPLIEVDFTAVVDADDLQEDTFGQRTLVYAAIYIDGKRLTDNLIV